MWGMDKEKCMNSSKFVVKGKKLNQIRSKILIVGVDHGVSIAPMHPQSSRLCSMIIKVT